jgi:hypothetical protein
MRVAELVEAASHELIAEMEKATPPGAVAKNAPETIPDLLCEFARQLAAQIPVLNHSTRWDRDGWREGIGRRDDLRDDAKAALLEAVARLGNLVSAGELSRGQIFQLRLDEDPILFFLGAMAWGYPEHGYGWWRVATIANRYSVDDLRNRLQRQIAAAAESPLDAWEAWSSIARLRGLGTAFASKLAYFAGTNPETGRGGPLIADRNTAWAIWAFAEDLDHSRTDPKRYVRYVDTLQRWAGGGRADELEHALFRLGPRVIKRWEQELLVRGESGGSA